MLDQEGRGKPWADHGGRAPFHGQYTVCICPVNPGGHDFSRAEERVSRRAIGPRSRSGSQNKGSRKNNLAFCCGSHAQLNHNRQAAMVCWAWEPQPCGARRPRRVSAALPLLDDITTSPASRRLASACPALAPKCQLILARTLRILFGARGRSHDAVSPAAVLAWRLPLAKATDARPRS